MKHWLHLAVAVAVLVTVAAAWASPDDKNKSENRTITGCLAKGDGADNFKITAQDGSKWDLSSKSVSLAEHVGHTVSVTGEVEHHAMHNLKEGAKDVAQDTGVKKDNTESGNLKVTSVKMVSESCSK